MSDRSIAQLESEVAAARAKLAADLAVLTSPRAVSHFRRSVETEAYAAKDRWVGAAQGAVRSRVQDFVDATKAKAAANPAAVAAIAAGVGWRLMRHPPVATVLVGAGLYSLFTTDRRQRPFIERHGLDEKAQALRTKVADTSEAVIGTARSAAERAQELASQVASAGQEFVAEARERIGHATGAAPSAREPREEAEGIWDGITANGARTTPVVRSAASDNENWDRMLLGAAGLAVAAAVGIASQRRGAERSH